MNRILLFLPEHVKALPMVTVIVGTPTTSGKCRIETLSNSADNPTYAEFHIADLKKGAPKWCNYVKGVCAQMSGKNTYTFDIYHRLRASNDYGLFPKILKIAPLKQPCFVSSCLSSLF